MLGASCPHAVYPQFPQAISSTATEQRCSGQRVGDNLWIPRGFLEESTGCPRIHAQCAQLARIWGPSWGRAVDAVWTTKPVHSRPRFILELSPGHPQADTRCELRKQAESTVSTGPITTPVLHLENFSSKQVVWTSLERTAPPDSARRETRRAGEAPGERSDRGPHTALPLRTDLSSVRRRGAGPSPVRSPRRSQHRSPALAQPPGPRHPGHCPKRRNPVLTTGRTSGFPASLPHRGGGQAPPGRREVGRRQLLEVTRSGSSTPLPWDDCGYGHATGERDYRPSRPDDPQRPPPRFIHTGTQLIRPGSGDSIRFARPAWPGRRRKTYPPVGGAADRVALNGVRSDVGRLCQTPGAAGPVFRPPHRPPCPAPVAESAQRDTRGQHSRRSTLNGRGHLGRWTLQA